MISPPPDWKVILTLKNGHRMSGLVRQELFSERPSGTSFAVCAPSDPGAGIRLWMVNDLRGYIFLLYQDLAGEVIRERPLSYEEGLLLDKQLASPPPETPPEHTAVPEEDAAEKEPSPIPTTDSPSSHPAMTSERARELLARFPPEKGWCSLRRDQILQKLEREPLTGVTAVTPEERNFVEAFQEWSLAKVLSLPPPSSPAPARATSNTPSPELP